MAYFLLKILFTFSVHLIYIDKTVSQVNMKSIFSRKWNFKDSKGEEDVTMLKTNESYMKV